VSGDPGQRPIFKKGLTESGPSFPDQAEPLALAADRLLARFSPHPLGSV